MTATSVLSFVVDTLLRPRPRNAFLAVSRRVMASSYAGSDVDSESTRSDVGRMMNAVFDAGGTTNDGSGRGRGSVFCKQKDMRETTGQVRERRKCDDREFVAEAETRTYRLELAPNEPLNLHLPVPAKPRDRDSERPLLSGLTGALVSKACFPSLLVNVADEDGELSIVLVEDFDPVQLETDVDHPAAVDEVVGDSFEDVVLRDEGRRPGRQPPPLKVGCREDKDLLRARREGERDGRVVRGGGGWVAR